MLTMKALAPLYKIYLQINGSSPKHKIARVISKFLVWLKWSNLSLHEYNIIEMQS